MKYFAFCALLVMPLTALAADANPDARFYKAAAQGGLAEVQAGQLAEQKSSNPKVKDFAAMMVKDHSAANDELTTLAASKGVTLPSDISVAQKAGNAKLEVLSGGSFDKSYIKSQVQAHKSTVTLLQKEISSGQDDDAKAFARKILPTVRSHLKAINSIAQDSPHSAAAH
jgi:putative membrane protein